MENALHSAIKSVGQTAHTLAGMNPQLAGFYLRLYRALKWLPDGNWKQFVTNSLQTAKWPDINLAPGQVELGRHVSARLVPHLYEFDFAAHFWRRMPYENEVSEWLAARSYDAVLEIGANIGFFTIFFAKLWPAAHIFSFEPSPAVYKRLLRNLELNACSNVQTFNCAVASGAGFVEFFEPEGHLTNGSLLPGFAAQFSDKLVPTKVLTVGGPELAGLIPPGQKLLVKIDVEGAEPIVLRSLQPVIAAHKPDLVLEVLPTTVNELNSLDVFGGYRLFALTRQGAVERSRFESGSTRDYAILPAETPNLF